MSDKKETVPPQKQPKQPGVESEMTPRPEVQKNSHQGTGKLQDKIAIITGGDSGIGRAVAVAFAEEGAHCVIAYLEEHQDADETRKMVESKQRKCVTIAGDVGDPAFCEQVVRRAVDEFGRVDILVNNAAEQHEQEEFENVTPEQVERTFRTNIFSMFYLTRFALRHMNEGSAIINTTSVTAYRGSEHLIDYSSTKGAIVSFTRSLAKNLASKRKIRVNAVAPGPIWTPLIPATFPPDKVKSFGADVPLGRPGQPSEVATCYLFLASGEASYMTGQVLHPNGGEVVNG